MTTISRKNVIKRMYLSDAKPLGSVKIGLVIKDTTSMEAIREEA
jgi:hypothetical protein